METLGIESRITISSKIDYVLIRIGRGQWKSAAKAAQDLAHFVFEKIPELREK